MPVVWGQFAGYGEDEFDKLLELSVALPESLHKNSEQPTFPPCFTFPVCPCFLANDVCVREK